MDTNKPKAYFWLLLDVLIAGLIVNLVFFVMPTVKRFGNSLAPVRTITVSAEGKALTTPDLALSSFSVISRGADPETIADTNNKKITAVISFLKSLGTENKDVQTTAYNLSPDYKYDPDTQRSFITGYTLTQTVSVKMRDFKKVPKILAGITPLGVNQIGGISFVVEEPEKFLAIARTEAIAKARAKAEKMARETGTSLGSIVTIGEYSSIPRPVPYYAAAARSAETVSVAAPTIEPGETEIRNQVTVTYELQ